MIHGKCSEASSLTPHGLKEHKDVSLVLAPNSRGRCWGNVARSEASRRRESDGKLLSCQ